MSTQQFEALHNSHAERFSPTPNQGEKLNGDFKAWYQLLSSFFLFMNSWGFVNSFGVYQTFYETVLLSDQASSADISWIGSIQSFLLVFMGVITGPLFDRGYYRALVFTGAFLTCLGIMMTSICTSYWQIMLAQGIVVGLGSGCLFVPSVAVLPKYFTSKKALAQGIAASGSSIGGVIFPIIFRRLQPTLGFGWTTRILGFLVLATFAFALACTERHVQITQARQLFDYRAWREWSFSLFSLACFFGFMGLYIPFFYLGLYATDHGISPSLAFYLLAFLNAASTFGRILPSFLADKSGPLNMIIPCLAVCILLCFLWLEIDGSGGLIAFAVLYGFFSGCFVSLPPTVIVTLSPSLGVVGTRMGMCFALAALGLLLGNPIAGVILRISHTGYDWHGLILWCGACTAAATLCLLGARTARVGLNIWKKI